MPLFDPVACPPSEPYIWNSSFPGMFLIDGGPLQNPYRLFCLILPLFLHAACSKEPLARERAQELIEASDEFQPQTVYVRLTEEEIKKGTDAG
jgi:hypothetical protein